KSRWLLLGCLTGMSRAKAAGVGGSAIRPRSFRPSRAAACRLRSTARSSQLNAFYAVRAREAISGGLPCLLGGKSGALLCFRARSLVPAASGLRWQSRNISQVPLRLAPPSRESLPARLATRLTNANARPYADCRVFSALVR